MSKRKSRSLRGRFDDRDALLDADPVSTLDLHGHTANECRGRLNDWLATWRRKQSGKVVHIITGKGKGSIGQPVLKNLVRQLLAGPLSVMISDSSEDIDGGGYKVRLR
jgi:DNA-nicking Smr family endonuclease